MLIHIFLCRTCFGPGEGKGSVMVCGRKNGKMGEWKERRKEGRKGGAGKGGRREEVGEKGGRKGQAARQAAVIPFFRQLIWVALSKRGCRPTPSSSTSEPDTRSQECKRRRG